MEARERGWLMDEDDYKIKEDFEKVAEVLFPPQTTLPTPL